MNNSIAVHVLEGGNDLQHKIASLLDSQFFSFFDHFAECFVGAQLKHNVHIFGVLEYAIKLDNMLMMECFVYFDLR